MASLLQQSILIIGGGTWGCSTALQLARQGYTNITVFDQSPIECLVCRDQALDPDNDHTVFKTAAGESLDEYTDIIPSISAFVKDRDHIFQILLCNAWSGTKGICWDCGHGCSVLICGKPGKKRMKLYLMALSGI